MLDKFSKKCYNLAMARKRQEVSQVADNKITATRPGLDTVKCVDMQTLTEKIKQLPPQAISYIAGAVEMASLLQNKGA
jgi:hypothetical protein